MYDIGEYMYDLESECSSQEYEWSLIDLEDDKQGELVEDYF